MISKTILFFSQERKIAGCSLLSSKHESSRSIWKSRNTESYFETIIRENPNWQFVKIYSDIGSALRTNSRPGYRQMILDGEKGLFDLVLVKSLSRFGRDTIETLTQIRKQKWRILIP